MAAIRHGGLAAELELAHFLRRDGKGSFELADCEIKSNWIRQQGARSKRSPFLDALHKDDIERLVATYFKQLAERNAVILAAVIDKRHLYRGTTHDVLHKRAYEYVLERIQHYMSTTRGTKL